MTREDHQPDNRLVLRGYVKIPEMNSNKIPTQVSFMIHVIEDDTGLLRITCLSGNARSQETPIMKDGRTHSFRAALKAFLGQGRRDVSTITLQNRERYEDNKVVLRKSFAVKKPLKNVPTNRFQQNNQ